MARLTPDRLEEEAEQYAWMIRNAAMLNTTWSLVNEELIEQYSRTVARKEARNG